MNFQLCIRLCTDVGIDPKDADAEGSCDVFQVSSLFVCVSDSVCARAPRGQQMPEVGSVDFAVGIHVRLRKSRVNWSPEREECAEVCAVDLVVDEQVRKALAGIGNRVLVEIRRTGCNLTHVANAVAVAVGLQRIEDGGAVVDRVAASIAIGIEWWWSGGCDGVVEAPRDT